MYTEEEISYFVDIGKLQINEKEVQWKRKQNYGSYEFRIPVAIIGEDDSLPITFLGIASANYDSFSYSIFWQNCKIRSIDPFTKHHTNKHVDGLSNRKVVGVHKHKFSSVYKDKTFAYKVTDINNPKDREQCFYGFLDECNIKHNLIYVRPPHHQYSLGISNDMQFSS